jgi:hypothetical protein
MIYFLSIYDNFYFLKNPKNNGRKKKWWKEGEVDSSK